jgi:hypothetical protein
MRTFRLRCLMPYALPFALAGGALGQPTTPSTSSQVLTGDGAIEGSVTRPETSGRVVKVFNFEEAKTNPGDVPRGWFRSFDEPSRARPGFPDWNKASLSYTTEGGVAFGGAGSVMLPTRGGSTALVVNEGVLPVFQNADYLISAKVRTDRLVHARAAMVARFLDKSGAGCPHKTDDDQWSLAGCHGRTRG